MMTSNYIVNAARFWKKFVHCDGSYGAGGRQGRYVFSWPAVRMILGFLFVPHRSVLPCCLSLTYWCHSHLNDVTLVIEETNFKDKAKVKKHKKKHNPKFILL